MPNPTTEKSAPGSQPRTAEGYPTREEVELRAYQIYVERGGAHGQDVEDWLQAEREVIVKYGKPFQKARAAAA